MKKIKQGIKKSITHPKVAKIIEQLKVRVKPIVEYYHRLNEREKQIVFFGSILVILVFFYFLISAAYAFQSGLQKEYMVVQTYKADVQYLSKLYKDINSLTPNEFSPVTVESIKGDLESISENKPDIELIGTNLTINISQVKFSDIMDALNQFRKSYGIFPDKVRITRLSESGYVSFSASFKVSTQNE